MNKIFLTLIAVTLLVSCGDKKSADSNEGGVDPNLIKNNMSANDPNASNPEPVMEFDNMTWNFGKINEGEEVTHTFKFKNTGNEELVISSCTASCGLLQMKGTLMIPRTLI